MRSRVKGFAVRGRCVCVCVSVCVCVQGGSLFLHALARTCMSFQVRKPQKAEESPRRIPVKMTATSCLGFSGRRL